MRTVPGLAARHGLDVDRLLAETPCEVLEEWRALYAMEPWGEERTDFAAGTTIMHLAAAAGAAPKAPCEYMHFLKKPEVKPQKESTMRQTFAKICEFMAKRTTSACVPLLNPEP